MRAWRKRSVGLVLAAMSLAAPGCAGPPEAEKHAAAEAIAAARSAGAERYASSEFAAMTAAFRKAEAEMTAQLYKEARASYAAARDRAERAARAAEAGKTAARADADRQLAAVEARWKDLHAKGDAGARTLRAEQKAMWNANASTVVEGLASARAAIAVDASSARAKLGAISARLDKIETDVAAMSKSPSAKK